MANAENPVRATGRCQCGGVSYTVRGPLRPIIRCHCEMCRRLTGGLWNATAALRTDLDFEDDSTLAWYRSSEKVRRGFCSTCGASLFYNPEHMPHIAIAAATIDAPTGLKLAVHIFTKDKADWYEIAGDVRQVEDHQHGLAIPEA